MIKNLHDLEERHQVVFTIIIATAVILFWRGIWGLLDMYLLPSSPGLSHAISVAIGLLILLLSNKLMKTFVYE